MHRCTGGVEAKQSKGSPGQARIHLLNGGHLQELRCERVLDDLLFRAVRVPRSGLSQVVSRRLANSIRRVGEVELAHVLKILAREATPESNRQVIRYLLD